LKPAPFDYVAADSLDGALEELARGAGDALVLAGGQTLMPLLALRMATPSVLVDINRIPELAGVRRLDGSTRIGAMTRQAQIRVDPVVARHVGPLAMATGFVGHHQTRNRGTLGGSVSLADPAAEYPATSLALGAQIEVRSMAGGVREIDADDFFLGPYTTALEPGEMVTALRYPDWPEGTVFVVDEVAPRPGDFAFVGLVFILAVKGGIVSRSGITWFSMGGKPMRSMQAEATIWGEAVDGVDWAAVAELAVSETDPIDDIHATAHYRRTVGKHLFQRVVATALAKRGAQ
jgi:carbon-monoxide dehydrogenase medium subunit